MKKALALLLALVMVLGLAACGGSSEESAAPESESEYGTYNWTLAMSVAESTTNYKMSQRFAELINERSGGSINVVIYPSGQLGNETEFTEGVIGGSIDIGTGITTNLVDYIPEMGLFDMPNLFTDLEQMRALLASDYIDTINQYCEESGVHMLGFSDAGFRQLTTNKRVDSIDDIAGQKIRVMTNNYHIAYWEALGASAVPMAFTEVFMGLQQNTIDGEENPYMNIIGNNFQEVQDYIVETNHLGHIITFFMNNELYNSLPANTKALVDECAAEAVEYANQLAVESIAADKQTCIDAGCEIITLSDEDYATLKEKSQVVYDMVRADLGDEKVDALLDAIEAIG